MSDIAPNAYLLTTIDGQSAKFAIPVDSALRIGRSKSASVVLNDESVSRHHALLQRTEHNQYYITDLGTRNGTYVNQKRVAASVLLRHHDRITIGSYTLIFCYETQAIRETARGAPETAILFAPKLITVMVADIRGFTGLAQRVEPDVLSTMTGSLFRKAGKALHELGTWAQKYIGDAVMAVWLHEDLAPTTAELRAVFDAVSQLTGIADGLQGTLKLDAPVRLGVGINTGMAMVGNAGSVAMSDYTALGEVVNHAFRLEAATRTLDCDLVLGKGTYDFLAPSIDAGILQVCTTMLKGYEEPATVYTAQIDSLKILLESLK
jgi:adenylate cyclase